jgi:hypothetical protein
VRPKSTRQRIFRLGVAIAGLLPVAGLAFSAGATQAAGPSVRLVGTYKGIHGQYKPIQAAVDAARPGDWILVAPGDYHERQDYAYNSWPAGVWITKSNLHLRGMNRNTVIVDGTKPGAPACSSKLADQDLGPNGQGRNGIEVHSLNFTANNVTIENLTTCNFLTSAGGSNGNQIWWNGGDGKGKIGLSGYVGNYLTATATYSNGVNYPAGSYGIFSSDATHGSWTYDYGSNMSDSAYYIGACQQKCDVVMNHDRGQFSALCLSSTNAGGYIVVENTECDLNKTGLVSNSQNNDDWPSPQLGACSSDPNEPHKGILGTSSCSVWMNNYLHDNNNPNVPGNGVSGLAGGGPVGTAMVLAGTNNMTLYHNTVVNNGAWGAVIADLPDQESGPANCNGGTWVPAPVGVCYWGATGNLSLDNQFQNNGFFGNPTNGDIGLATIAHNPGNCFSGDQNPIGGATTTSTWPAGMEVNPLYQPTNGVCTQANSGDMTVLAAEALCDTQLVAPCPTLNTLCIYNASLPCIPAPAFPLNYPRPGTIALSMPPAQTTMSNPCSGAPANAWCPKRSEGPATAAFVPVAGPGAALLMAGWIAGGRLTSRRRRRAD